MKKRLLIMASLFYPQKWWWATSSIKNLVDSIYDEFDIYVISKNHEINEKAFAKYKWWLERFLFW